eukprot:Rmarinus@m.27380
MGIRRGCAGYIFATLMLPIVFGKPVNEFMKKDALSVFEKSMKILDASLTSSQYIASEDKPSIADLSLFCELHQLVLLTEPAPVKVEDFDNLRAWQERMRKLPGQEEMHKQMQFFSERLAARAEKLKAEKQ